MGLDTTHECWHGPYSAFGRWRNELARVAGYSFYKQDGFDIPLIDWGHLPDETLFGEWARTPDDPLIVLIAHSDCEGVIHPAQADALAKRLEELIPLLPEEKDRGHIGSWRAKTQQFVDGLREAVERNEDVEFG